MIKILEKYILNVLHDLITENIHIFKINETHNINLNDHTSISKSFETNIRRIVIRRLDNIEPIEPIYVSSQSDITILHRIPDDFFENPEDIVKYKEIYINIDAKAIKNDDNDSNFEKLHFSSSQTSIRKFYGKKKNGEDFNIDGKQTSMINDRVNLTFLVKGTWSNDDKIYKYEKIHLYCIPNGSYFNNVKLIINPKSYPKTNGPCEIRLKTEQLPDKYYVEIKI